MLIAYCNSCRSQIEYLRCLRAFSNEHTYTHRKIWSNNKKKKTIIIVEKEGLDLTERSTLACKGEQNDVACEGTQRSWNRPSPEHTVLPSPLRRTELAAICPLTMRGPQNWKREKEREKKKETRGDTRGEKVEICSSQITTTTTA